MAKEDYDNESARSDVGDEEDLVDLEGEMTSALK
jgi:hypothetical protein